MSSSEHPTDKDLSTFARERLRRLRDYSARAQVPDSLWSGIRAHIRFEATGSRFAISWPVASLAAAALMAVGFIGGRLTLLSDAERTPSVDQTQQAATLAMQESSTRFVHALFAAPVQDANAASVTFEQRREVALVALRTMINASAAEFPREVEQLIAGAQGSGASVEGSR